MKYKEELNEFLDKNFHGYDIDVTCDYAERYFISVNGKVNGHFISIDLDTFRGENSVALYSSYDDDVVLSATDENLVKIFEVALKMKQFGFQIKYLCAEDGREHCAGGICEEPFTPEIAKQIMRRMGEKVAPCILECSNFDGSINFSVKFD